jgi:sigma-B regulation protein RsbU (phosphoserine phosphatase)
VIVGWETELRDQVRLAALERSGLVGTGPEDAFDRLSELAAELVGLPRGCITLVDGDRTTAKASTGFPEGSLLYAPVERSFCRYVVSTGQPLIVNDARTDPRTSGDPAIEAFDAVAWAGYPIQDAHGAVLGTFCLMDARPHDWSAEDLLILATLAQAASSEIALRRSRMNTAEAEQLAAGTLESARRRQAALVAHLAELVGNGELSDQVERRLVVWMAAGEDATPDGSLEG